MLTNKQKEILNQINAKELRFANFIIMGNGDNSIIVKKGKKFVIITYNSMDLYDVEVGSYNSNFKKKSKMYYGIYYDQLQNIIEKHYPRFEYVMDGIMNNRK